MWTRCAAALVSNSPAADMSLEGLLRVANMRSPQSLLVFPARAWAEHGEFESRMMQLGCAASLRAQLAALAGEEWVGGWEVRMHLDTDPVQSLLHMVKGIAARMEDCQLPVACRLPPAARCLLYASTLSPRDTLDVPPLRARRRARTPSSPPTRRSRCSRLCSREAWSSAAEAGSASLKAQAVGCCATCA